MSAPRFDILQFLDQASGYASEDAHALMAVAPLDKLVSFDRDKMGSVSVRAEDGVKLREPVQLYADDILSVHVERAKASHVKTATVELRSRTRALRRIRPGDWAAVWLVPRKPHLDDLVKRVKDGLR